MQFPVTYSRRQRPVRLLELPPELLALVEAEGDDSVPLRLSFKAADASVSAGSGPGTHVVLTSAVKTYQLRQVQTSNTVLLLHQRRDGSLEVRSRCTSALELEDLPALAPSDPRAVKTMLQHLTALLPVYTGPDDLDDGGPPRDVVSANIPYSEAEVDAAWVQLAAFTTAAGRSFRPSSSALLDLWSATMTGATLAGIDLASSDGVQVEQLWRSVDTQHPAELMVATLSRISSRRLNASRNEVAGAGDAAAWMVLDGERGAAWICSLVERPAGQQQQQGLDVQQRLERCRAHVPEAWRALVTAESLGRVGAGAGEPGAAAAAASAGAAGGAGAATAGTAGAGKAGEGSAKRRDWHERFKRARR